MPTVFPNSPGERLVEAPRLDLTSSESTRRLIFRVKDNNRALEELRAALDDVETFPVVEPGLGRA